MAEDSSESERKRHVDVEKLRSLGFPEKLIQEAVAYHDTVPYMEPSPDLLERICEAGAKHFPPPIKRPSLLSRLLRFWRR